MSYPSAMADAGFPQGASTGDREDDHRVASLRSAAIIEATRRLVDDFPRDGIPKWICEFALERLPADEAAGEVLHTSPWNKTELIDTLKKRRKRAFATNGFEASLVRAGERISGKPYTFELNGLRWRVTFHGPGSKKRGDADAHLIFFRIEAKLVGTIGGHTPVHHVRYHRLSFRTGRVQAARFVPGELRVVYAAAFAGGPLYLYECRSDGPDTRRLQDDPCGLFCVSGDGHLALCVDPQVAGFGYMGKLAQVRLLGGGFLEERDAVESADYGPRGLALVTAQPTPTGGRQLEYPAGKVLCDTTGWFSHIRCARDGARIAVAFHPLVGDASGSIALVTLDGRIESLSDGWKQVLGLAWSPDETEVWFTATRSGSAGAVHAVNVETKALRLLLSAPAQLTLHDVSATGEVLLTADDARVRMMGKASPDAPELELSHFDWTHLRDISDDGRTILFDESGDGAGDRYAIYRRRFDTSEPVYLGEGAACSLGPDGSSLLAISMESRPHQLSLISIRTGARREVTDDAIAHDMGVIHPDGRRVVFAGARPGEGRRLWVLDLATGETRPISPPGVMYRTVYPLTCDGRHVTGQTSASRHWLYPLDGGEPQHLAGLSAGDYPIRWDPDGSLFVARIPHDPCEVFRLNLASGSREPLYRLRPPDPTGLVAINIVRLSRGATAYAYCYMQHTSRLYLVEGIR